MKTARKQSRRRPAVILEPGPVLRVCLCCGASRIDPGEKRVELWSSSFLHEGKMYLPQVPGFEHPSIIMGEDGRLYARPNPEGVVLQTKRPKPPRRTRRRAA